MAYLKIQRDDGSTETLDLSHSQPINIGRQPLNDLCIPEHGVRSLHCRIGWNKTNYEITAGSSQGVDVNSTTVASATLKHGDVIRIGSVDLIFEDGARKKHTPATDRKHRQKVKIEATTEVPAEDLSLFEGKVLTESQELMEEFFDEDLSSVKSSREQPRELPTLKRRETEYKPSPKSANRQLRPGEQEILRSPLVLGLTGGGLVLLLVTGVFWFLMAREQANKLYERAAGELSSGQYQPAIASYEQFLKQYPNHGQHRQAERGLAKAFVLKEISGASPSWNRGLERLNELIQAHRSEPDFADMHSDLFQYAEQISLGAAKSAESARDAELLSVSKEAQTLLERFADPANPPTGTVARISEQRTKAERAIDKQRTFDQSMKIVNDAIANKQPMEALSERERLVRLFPEFINARRVKEALQKSLDLEKSVASVDVTEKTADTADDPQPGKDAILGLLHSRSRTDESSQGRLVFAVARDSCYAIDAVTGELVWRRVIGTDSPFFPISNTTAAVPSLLLFDTRSDAMVACDLATGKLIWKLPLGARAIGNPLLHEGQIYLSLEGNSLVRIDVDSGRLSATAHFSQRLATGPVLARDGKYLLVPGEMAMIYSLTLHSTATNPILSTAATTFTDHAAGSISAPPLSMGRLLFICENDKADSARLRLWDASNPAESLVELSSTNVRGQVRDAPVLRGNQLVVASSGEQFAAFAVTDDPGRAGISPIGQYRADQARVGELPPSPLFIALGSDGQFWSAGSAFRRFEIISDTIRMDSNSSAPGIASQPLQQSGDFFFVGRKSRYSSAVTFSAIEREKLVNPWRCIVGDTPLELLPTRDDGIYWVGESGTIYNIGKNRIGQGGIELKAGVDPELPPNVTRPLRATALPDRRMIVAAAGETKVLHLLNNSGQLTGRIPLPDMVEADPVLIDDGLVLPLPGRLKVISLSGDKKSTQDWIATVGETQRSQWTHLVRIDGRELIACDSNGAVLQIQYRKGDTPHLAEVAKLQFEQPVEIRPVLRDKFLYVADAAGHLRKLNVQSFDTDSEVTLPAPIRQLWSFEPLTIVATGDGKLHSFADGKELNELWTFESGPLEPLGPIVTKGDDLWLACRNGTILVLNSKSGEERRRIELPQQLSLGLRQIKDDLFAVAIDGTLYRVE